MPYILKAFFQFFFKTVYFGLAIELVYIITESKRGNHRAKSYRYSNNTLNLFEKNNIILLKCYLNVFFFC